MRHGDNVLCSFCKGKLLDHPAMACGPDAVLAALGASYKAVGVVIDRLDCGELREIERVRAGISVSWS